MSHYKHITIDERENLYLMRHQGMSIRKIAAALNRSPSTISRELARNILSHRPYSPSAAQARYHKRRKNCGKRPLLTNNALREEVRTLMQDHHWSPEQVSFRLRMEENPLRISYTTIYRGINSGLFDPKQKYFAKSERFSFYLRRKGKKRRKNGTVNKQGKYRIPYTIDQRPEEAEARAAMGYREADTVAGKKGSASVVTLTDRKSRYLLARKVENQTAEVIAEAMIDLLSALPAEKVRGITPDRGKEFAKHSEVSAALYDVKFYFADPYSPWQRGTNENTNGLLRECIPKGKDIAPLPEDTLARFVEEMNRRPRKCLGWESPYEVFFDSVLHLT